MFRFLTTSAIALIAGAAPVLADVTPAQVWENLESYYTDLGYQVTTGGKDEAGETLTLSDVTLKSEGDATSMTFTLPKMTMQQTGDAKVRTVIDGEITADGVTRMADGEEETFDLAVTMSGNEMLSSGTPDDMLHEVTYPELTASVGMGSLMASDGKRPITLTATDLKGQYRTVQGDGQEATYDMTAAGLDLNIAMDEPAGEDGDDDHGSGKVTAQSHLEGITVSGRMTIPEGDFNINERVDLALNAGMVAEAKMSMDGMAGSAEFAGVDEDGAAQTGSAKFSSDSGELNFAMSKDGINYQGTAKGTKAEMQISDVPFPISYAVDSASGGVNFPVSKSDEAQPFKLSYALAGLTLADGIWDLFDPQKELPRDPANLTIDLEGEAVVRQDLFDPAFGKEMEEYAELQMQEDPEGDNTAMDEMPAPPPSPFEPKSVKINQFTLQAVGVSADVTGDLTLPQGEDQPVGTVEGSFEGVNALLDKLVAMGVVPQDQVMGARMMIAMFAKPAEGNPDKLNTTLEFKEDGSIFANGQQVK